MSRGPLEVLRDTLGFVEASLGSSDEMPTSLREAIAQVEALVFAAESARSDLAWAERTVPGTNFQASLILLNASLPAFTPGQDSEGGCHG